MTNYKLSTKQEEEKQRMISGGVMGSLNALLVYDILNEEKYRAQIDEEHPTLKNDPYLYRNTLNELIFREIKERNYEIMSLVEKYAKTYLQYDYEKDYFGSCLRDLESSYTIEDWKGMRMHLEGLSYLIAYH